MILDRDKIQKINLFEGITNSRVKYLIDNGRLIFIVNKGDIGKAIGQKGKNIKTIEKLMHKKIKVIEFNDNVIDFVNNFIYPLKADSIILNNNFIEIKTKDRKTKGLLIGRESKNLNELNALLKDYFNFKIKVL